MNEDISARVDCQDSDDDDSVRTDHVAVPTNVLNKLDRWLEALPEEAQPHNLRHQFPKVLIRLLQSWKDPEALHKTFEAVIIDGRGDRTGFPMDVMSELHALRSYYFDTLHPEASKLFEPVHGVDPILLSRQ